MDGDLDDTGAVEDWALITRVVAAAHRRTMDAFEAAGLPAQDFAALQLLLRSPHHRLRMTDIATDLAMTSGGLTKLADRLGSAGLIERRGTSTDRRTRFAALTPAGVELAQHTAGQYQTAVHEHIVTVIGTEHLSAIADILRCLDPARRPALDADAGADAEPEPIPQRDPTLPDRRNRTSPPSQE